MEFANAFVTSEPVALHPRAPKVSIQDLHLNLTDEEVGWYSISLHGLFRAYDMPLMTCEEVYCVSAREGLRHNCEW